MRARRVPAATLMRGAVVAASGRLPWRDALLIGAVALALAAFTIFTADSRSIAGWFVLGAVGGVHGLPAAGAAPDAGRRACRQAPARRPAAGARQPAPARRAHAHRHAVAGAWPHRAGGDGADRGQSARAAHAAHPERRAGLLLRRHPVDPDAGLREGDRRHPGRRRARQGAVAARPHRQARRQAGRRGRRAVGGALGGRWRPRRHLFGDAARGLAHRRRRMVAGRLSRAAAHLLRRGAGARPSA